MVGPSPVTANSAGLEQTHVLSPVRPRRAPGCAALCPACAGPTVSRGSLRASPPPRSPCPRPPRPQGWCPSRPPSPPWRGSWARQPGVPASHLPMLRTPPGLPRAVPSRTPGSRARTAAHVSGPTSRGPRLGPASHPVPVRLCPCEAPAPGQRGVVPPQRPLRPTEVRGRRWRVHSRGQRLCSGSPRPAPALCVPAALLVRLREASLVPETHAPAAVPAPCVRGFRPRPRGLSCPRCRLCGRCLRPPSAQWSAVQGTRASVTHARAHGARPSPPLLRPVSVPLRFRHSLRVSSVFRDKCCFNLSLPLISVCYS